MTSEGVSLELNACVDQDNIATLKRLIIADVVKDRCVAARADDRAVRRPRTAASAKDAPELCFEFVLVTSGMGDPGSGVMGIEGDVGGALHDGDLGFALEQAHLVERDSRVNDFVCREKSAAGLAANFFL